MKFILHIAKKSALGLLGCLVLPFALIGMVLVGWPALWLFAEYEKFIGGEG